MVINIHKAKKSDVDEIIKVHVESWKTTYKGLLSESFIQNFISRTKDQKWQKQLKNLIEDNIFYIAENDKREIVGFAIGGLERSNNPNYDGELMGIYILKEYQRQGIGKALTWKIVEKLINMNINSMLLWVLESNPYRAFYEAIGGKIVDKKLDENLKVPVIAYGYNNLIELIKKKID